MTCYAGRRYEEACGYESSVSESHTLCSGPAILNAFLAAEVPAPQQVILTPEQVYPDSFSGGFMAGSTRLPRIPLPRNWPRRVRSAVIHAISLAHFSLTSTRSWAANSWNARVRLKAENQRLRQELALLQEEMRIKDSRMLRVPAQRRPHYPPRPDHLRADRLPMFTLM